MNTHPSNGWISRIAAGLFTIAVLILGFFFLSVALAAGAIVAVVFGARLWWTLRKLKRMQTAAGSDTGDAGANVVEGDYQIIEHESAAVRLPPRS
jgi:hypothetical protein